MLHLRRCVLARLLSSPAASPIPPLHHLLSAAAPAVSPNRRFAAEEYLVETCGLSRAQAHKASTKLTHLKSPSNPDTVLAFLAGVGLSGADVAAIVAKDPQFLCAGVETTLAPILVGLTGLGLSRSEIARLVSLAPVSFRYRSVISNLPYYLSLFGSYSNLLPVLRRNSNLLVRSLEKVVMPNVLVLRECSLSVCDIANLFTDAPWIFGIRTERLRVMVACAGGLGVPRGSAMFKHALHAVAFLDEEEIATRAEHLKNTFWWSDAEVRIAVCKALVVLRKSKEAMQSISQFLVSDVGLAPAYIAQRPAILSYSLEGRLRPRYYVLKFLKEKGLLDHDRDYYAAVVRAEKVFLERYIHPYKETAPHLAEDYATACSGKVPSSFRFA